ncbi:hypothetical protein D9M68_920130 [compost metagenome]
MVRDDDDVHVRAAECSVRDPGTQRRVACIGAGEERVDVDILVRLMFLQLSAQGRVRADAHRLRRRTGFNFFQEIYELLLRSHGHTLEVSTHQSRAKQLYVPLNHWSMHHI